MLATLFINPVFWVLGACGLLAWGRFVMWLSIDVESLAHQSIAMWRNIAVGSLVLLTLVWLVVPMFWIAFVLALAIAGGVVGWYWVVRVKVRGAAGHLFAGTLQKASSLSQNIKYQQASRNITLAYFKADDSPMPLPAADDPLAQGLAMADQLFAEAASKRAESVELLPTSQSYEIRFLVDGVSYPQQNVERNVAESMIQATKNLAGLAIEERRRPQQGIFKVRSQEGITNVWTVRSSGTTLGERMAASANEKGRWNFALDHIGLAADQLAVVKSIIADTKGVVVVAAPKLNGRTATLYSLVRSHDAFTTSVQTLESTPQDEMEGVTVNRFDPRSSESSYAKALQSVFLKDPNVVLSQQCPDAQTAGAIAKYGGDDHRVYVGITAFDALASLDLWLRIVPDKKVGVQSLRAIIAQRLVRLLCPTCKIAYQPDEATLKKYNLPLGRNLQSFKANTEPLVDQKGNQYLCPDCGGLGYRGRTGIFEVLLVTDEMKKAIIEGANLQGIRGLARKNNMMLLVEHGFRKFASGLTSIQEVARVLTPEKTAPPPG
jgi:type II secretory ATPase GspE/PulE/Tfp pilus assembly ATPase PilB-like protein